MSARVSEITSLLERAPSDAHAQEAQFRLIEQRFREIAGALLRKEGQAGSWQETIWHGGKGESLFRLLPRRGIT